MHVGIDTMTSRRDCDVEAAVPSTHLELRLVNKQLKKIVRLMQICGIYVHNADTRRLRFVYMVYPIISLLYQGFVVISKGTNISFTDAFGPDVFYSILVFIFRGYLFTIFCISTFTMATLRRLRSKVQLIWMTKSEAYRKKFSRNFTLMTNIGIGIIVVVYLGNIGGNLYNCISLSPVYLDYIIPLWSNSWSSEFEMSVCIVCTLLDMIMLAGVWSFTTLYILTWYLVISEFHNINEEIGNYIETQHITYEYNGHTDDTCMQGDDVTDEPRFDLEDFRLHHAVICHMVDLANGLFKFVILATSGVSLLVTCLALYYFAKVDASVDMMSMLTISSHLCVSLFTLVTIIITGVVVNDKVRLKHIKYSTSHNRSSYIIQRQPTYLCTENSDQPTHMRCPIII